MYDGVLLDFSGVYVGKIQFGVFFLSRDAMTAGYIPSSCVRLCGVDVAYRRLSDGLVCSGHCTASTRSGRVHSLP